MRRLLAFSLLIVMSLQLTWAAASLYCQHENGDAASHFGHHVHEHKVDGGTVAPHDPIPSGNMDSDCAFCHAGCACALTSATAQTAVASAVFGVANYRIHSAAPPLARPERPQWRVLA